MRRMTGDEVISRDDQTPLVVVDGGVAPGLTDLVVDFQEATEDRQTAGGFKLRPRLVGD